MEHYFKLKQNGTTVTTEIRAGLTTFIAMAYIIFLNPVFLSETGMSTPGILAATCLSAAIGTIISAFFSNKPFAMASGMGMNAYFTYTLCFSYGYTWQQALTLTLISGFLFLIIALIAGKKAISFIPENLRHAITAGIGMFIMLIGLLDSGIIQMTEGYPELGNIKSLPVLTSLLGLLIIIVLTVKNVRGSLIIGMLITALFSLLTGQTVLPDHFISFPSALRDVIFHLDFSGLLTHGSILTLISIIISMTIVDMFDTLGFLIGTVSKTSDHKNQEETSSLNRVLIADALSTMIGSLCGTSTVTVYAESASGIEAGGKTGLTALTTACFFLLAVFFSPITSIFNTNVTSPALILVGILLLMDIKKITFNHMHEVIPAILTIVMMPMTYSITAGIAVGFLSYAICKIAAKQTLDLTPSTLILCCIFILYFIL